MNGMINSFYAHIYIVMNRAIRMCQSSVSSFILANRTATDTPGFIDIIVGGR